MVLNIVIGSHLHTSVLCVGVCWHGVGSDISPSNLCRAKGREWADGYYVTTCWDVGEVCVYACLVRYTGVFGNGHGMVFQYLFSLLIHLNIC